MQCIRRGFPFYALIIKDFLKQLYICSVANVENSYNFLHRSNGLYSHPVYVVNISKCLLKIYPC